VKLRRKPKNFRDGHVFRIDGRTGDVIYMEDMIMEHKLGRRLTDRERVLHLNGNPLDNRDSNLTVVIISEEGI